MFKSKAGARVKCRTTILNKQRRTVTFRGIVKLYHIHNGVERLIAEGEANTIQNAFLYAVAKGVKDGAFTPPNHLQFRASGPVSLAIETISKEAGGTGAENYVTYSATYTNSSGSEKTVTDLRFGYDISGGSERIDATKDIVDHAVPNGDGLKVTWQISLSVSGELLNDYSYRVMRMVAVGSFDEPDDMYFQYLGGGGASGTCNYLAGGTGAEAYVSWRGVFTAVSGVTIDIVEMKGGAYTYVEHDYDPDHVLAIGEGIQQDIEITHTAA